MNIADYKGIWVFAEQREGKLQKVSLELLGEGKKLANELGVKLTAILLGNNVEGLASTLPAQCCRQRFVNRLFPLLQRNHARFQSGGFDHCLHQKIQLVQLTALCCQKFLLFLLWNFLLHQRIVDHF